ESPQKNKSPIVWNRDWPRFGSGWTPVKAGLQCSNNGGGTSSSWILSEDLPLHDNLALVIEFAFMPEGPVRQMVLARGRAYHELLGGSFVMRPALIPAGSGRLTFRIRHNCNLFI